MPEFLVEVPGYSGPLEGLVLAVQRGDVDASTIEVSAITGDYRKKLSGAESEKPESQDVADFLVLASRLLALKAQKLLPDGAVATLEDEGPVDDPGRRLAEYLLFKEAAELLLSDISDSGTKSFLSLVVPEVLPQDRLAIEPERLAQAFRKVLARLPAVDLEIHQVTFSVEEKVAWLRGWLKTAGTIQFETMFEKVESRLEAVACFLALLDLMRKLEVAVQQSGPFGPIEVKYVGA